MHDIESITELMSAKNRLAMEAANLEQRIVSQWRSLKEQATPVQLAKQFINNALVWSPQKKRNGEDLLKTLGMYSAEIIYKSIARFRSRRSACI
jgi:hypothetical protein